MIRKLKSNQLAFLKKNLSIEKYFLSPKHDKDYPDYVSTLYNRYSWQLHWDANNLKADKTQPEVDFSLKIEINSKTL